MTGCSKGRCMAVLLVTGCSEARYEKQVYQLRVVARSGVCSSFTSDRL